MGFKITKISFQTIEEGQDHTTFLADPDPNRALLDRRVICDLLSFDEIVYERS